MVADGWNERIGSVWGAVLAARPAAAQGVVVELGPGFADKVGLGLARQRFRGTLYVVEPNEAARGWVAGRYRRLLPDADIVEVAEPVPSAARLLPEHVDVLVMNHVLDDFVLFAALPPADRERVFGGMRADRPGAPEFQQTWQHLFGDPERLRGLGARVVDDLRHVLARTRPRTFAASQYESWYLIATSHGHVDRFGAALLADLAAPLGPAREADCEILRRHGQDPDRWLIREMRPGEGRAA